MELYFENVQIQNANIEANCDSHQIWGLVYHNRSKRCILPYTHHLWTQEIPQVCFWGRSFPISCSSFQLSFVTFTKHMDAALAPPQLQGIRKINYIDDWLILSKEMAVRHWDIVLAHIRCLGLRFNNKTTVLSTLQRTAFLGLCVTW